MIVMISYEIVIFCYKYKVRWTDLHIWYLWKTKQIEILFKIVLVNKQTFISFLKKSQQCGAGGRSNSKNRHKVGSSALGD